MPSTHWDAVCGQVDIHQQMAQTGTTTDSTHARLLAHRTIETQLTDS